jgi:hypothetical protein
MTRCCSLNAGSRGSALHPVANDQVRFFDSLFSHVSQQPAQAAADFRRSVITDRDSRAGS